MLYRSLQLVDAHTCMYVWWGWHKCMCAWNWTCTVI